MPDIAESNWSERDDLNSEVAPFGFPPGLPAAIEQIGQMMMGAVKRSYNRLNPVYLTTGTGDNYVVTTESQPGFINLYEIISVRADRSNTIPAPTLQYAKTAARVIMKITADGKVALVPEDIVAGNAHSFWYDGTNWILANPIASLALADTAVQPNTTPSFTGLVLDDISCAPNGNNELVFAEGNFISFGDVGGTKFGPNGIIIGRDGTDTAVAFVSSLPNTKTEVVINPSGTPTTDEWATFSVNRIAGANEERLNLIARGGTFNDFTLGEVIIGTGQYRPFRWNIAGHPTLTVTLDDDVLFFQRLGIGVAEGTRPGQLLEVAGNAIFGVSSTTTDYGIELRAGGGDWKQLVSGINGGLFFFDQVNNKIPVSIAFNSPGSAFAITTDTSNPVNVMVGGASKQVTAGATDSGGTGFKVLRVPN